MIRGLEHLDSKENIWKATLDKFQLAGQHYLLNKKQSSDIRKALKINGIPYYLLIDEAGTIIEKGSYLRPKIAKNKIEELLKKTSYNSGS